MDLFLLCHHARSISQEKILFCTTYHSGWCLSVLYCAVWGTKLYLGTLGTHLRFTVTAHRSITPPPFAWRGHCGAKIAQKLTTPNQTIVKVASHVLYSPESPVRGVSIQLLQVLGWTSPSRRDRNHIESEWTQWIKCRAAHDWVQCWHGFSSKNKKYFFFHLQSTFSCN